MGKKSSKLLRLSNKQREIIERIATRHFGKNVKVFLFGSRTNTEEKGGDIDLYLELVPSSLVDIQRKIAFIVDLKKDLGDQKIDVVFNKEENSTSKFRQIVDKTKIPIR